MTKRAAVSTVVLLAAATASLAADEKTRTGEATGSHAAFEQFKQLAGEWAGTEIGKEGHDGRDVHVTYKVTAGGSAVVETLFPGTEHEMITVIHPDGDDLLLTHYCMLGNQPQMKTSGTADGNKVEFKFVRATNLKSDKAMYMHDVTFTFVNKNTLKSEWTHYNNGKSAGRVVFELKRKP